MFSERSEQESRFLFHANAYAVGGVMRRPHAEVLPTRGSCVLPQVGGEARARLDGYTYRDLLSIGRSEVKVSGNVQEKRGKRIYNTLSQVVLEDVNIADLITADRVVARLVSRKVEGEEELPMLPVGSSIKNLCINGRPVKLRGQESLFEIPTLEKMHEQGEIDALDERKRPLRIHELRDLVPEESSGRVFQDQRVLTSLFSVELERGYGFDSETAPEGKPFYPWSIYIPGFGTVHFGEFLMTRHSRTLTMIRLSLGSPEEGDVQLASTQGNGSTYP